MKQRVNVFYLRRLPTMEPSPFPQRVAIFDGHKGFSLIELLIVISIIAILAALLLSALSGTKLQTQQIGCISNLKQLVLANNMYVDDTGREFPFTIGGNVGWIIMLPSCYGNDIALQLCPSASKVQTYTNPFDDFQAGAADTTWVLESAGPAILINTNLAHVLVTNVGSYAFNMRLCDLSGLYSTAELQVSNYFPKPSDVQYPSLTPVLADSVSSQINPDSTDLPSQNLYLGGGDTGLMSSLTIARHGSRPASAAPTNVNIAQPLPGMIDLALFDGHVEKSPLENLWNYYWCFNWEIPNPRPGR